MDAKKMITLSNLKNGWHSARIKYSDLEKMKFITEGIQNESSISEYCKEKGIYTDFFFKWKKDIAKVTVRKMINGRNGSVKNEVIHFETENMYLKKLINELETENKLLRKRLDERNKAGIN